MIGKTISHYKIVAKLGEGGMGEVYEAQDLDLDRTVALKFLKHASLTTEAERKRFQREAQAAASLDHPNICTIYEIGQSDGVAFIAMAYIDGSGMNERVEACPLPLKEAVDYGIQIADGLHAAHEKGIVHRDIKSANVIIDEKGRVKITDFGLAMREGQSRLTQTGLTVGTSAYMSPEQCRGESVDQRTDIWALGVVLYEMISARLPFVAEHNTALVYSILNADPEPITGLRSRVPMELERIVEKALAKDPVVRYQHADELAADLKRVQREIESTTGRPATAKTDRGWPRVRITSAWIALVTVAVVVAGFILFYPSQTVPFTERGWMIIADFDNDTGESVFDGIVTEALSIDLQQSKHVNIFPRQRIDQALQRMGRESAEFVDEDTAREVAQREDVSAVLSGAVKKVGPSYVLTARILVPTTGEAVRTVRVEANDSGQILGAIDDLSRQVRRDLGESLASIWRHDKSLEKVTTRSLQALQYYTMATKKMALARWDDAVPLLHQAIEEDSSFAIAYSKLGVIYTNMNDWSTAFKYSTNAYELSDRVTDRERYYIEARYYEDLGERIRAIDSYKLLVQMYPDDYVGRNNLAFRLQYTYEYEEALEHALVAARINPDTWYTHHNLASIYAGIGDYESSIDRDSKALQINPEGYWSYIGLSWVYSCQGNPVEGKTALENLPSESESWQGLKLLYLGQLHHAFGQDEAALQYLRKGISIDNLAGRVDAESWKWVTVAEIRKSLGDTDGALEAYRKAGNLNRPAKIMAYLGAGYAAVGKWSDADSIGADLHADWGRDKTHDDLAWIERLSGDLAMVRGDYNEASDFLERSVVMREYLETRYWLGCALRRAGQYDRAIEEFVTIDTKRYGTFFEGVPWIWPLSLYEMGLAHQAAGDPRAAAGSFKRFLALWDDADPNREEVLDARERLQSLE